MRRKTSESKVTNRIPPNNAITPKSEEHAEILAFLKAVKFRKKLFGGIDERSVWKKLDELSKLYDVAIVAEQIRYKALTKEYKRAALIEIDKRDKEIERLREIISKKYPENQPVSEGGDEK